MTDVNHMAGQWRAAGTVESNHHRLVGKRYRKKLLHSSVEMCQEHIQQP